MTGSRWMDAHCHLANPRITSNVAKLVANANEQGITCFLQGGIDPDDWQRQLQLRVRFPGQIHCAFGLHPWWVATHSQAEAESALQQLNSLLPNAVALGETGLDFLPRFPESSHSIQLGLFKTQLKLAAKHSLPLILHIVKAHAPALAALNELRPPHGGIIHSFSGPLELAQEYLKLGFTISIGAAALRPQLGPLERTIRDLPAQALVIESDSPDQLDSPSQILSVAEAVARIRQSSARTVLSDSAETLSRIIAPLTR